MAWVQTEILKYEWYSVLKHFTREKEIIHSRKHKSLDIFLFWYFFWTEQDVFNTYVCIPFYYTHTHIENTLIQEVIIKINNVKQKLQLNIVLFGSPSVRVTEWRTKPLFILDILVCFSLSPWLSYFYNSLSVQWMKSDWVEKVWEQKIVEFRNCTGLDRLFTVIKRISCFFVCCVLFWRVCVYNFQVRFLGHLC